MFGIGVPELILILVIGLVIFGPGKLPGVGKALGQSIKEFKQAILKTKKPLKYLKKPRKNDFNRR